MLRSTIISIKSAISSPAKLTNKDEPARWPSGAPSRPDGRWGLGVLRATQTTGRYSDKAKKGVRYRYYVSHARLQGRPGDAGSVARVSAPDVEALIANGLRANSVVGDDASDREIIENHLGRAILGRDQITIALRSGDLAEATSNPNDAPTISVPFRANLPLRRD